MQTTRGYGCGKDIRSKGIEEAHTYKNESLEPQGKPFPCSIDEPPDEGFHDYPQNRHDEKQKRHSRDRLLEHINDDPRTKVMNICFRAP